MSITQLRHSNRFPFPGLCLLAIGIGIAGCKQQPSTPPNPPAATNQAATMPAGVPRTWLDPAQAGDPDAQYHLGLVLYFGYKAPNTQEEAIEMFRRATDKRLAGKPQVMEINFRRQDGVTFNAEEGLKWLIRAAENQHVLAQYHLGDIYLAGKGVPTDFGEGIKWLTKAAENGNGWAQYQMAHIYAGGEGVEKDPEKAAKWFRHAAEQGNVHAQYDFGSRLVSGQGVTRDFKEAAIWLSKAAAADHAWGQFDLGVLLSEKDGYPHDFPQAAKWFRESADQGNAESQYMLAVMYSRGRGVEEDEFEAYKWVHLATTNGDARHYRILHKQLESKLSQEQIAAAHRWAARFVPRKTRAPL